MPAPSPAGYASVSRLERQRESCGVESAANVSIPLRDGPQPSVQRQGVKQAGGSLVAGAGDSVDVAELPGQLDKRFLEWDTDGAAVSAKVTTEGDWRKTFLATIVANAQTREAGGRGAADGEEQGV